LLGGEYEVDARARLGGLEEKACNYAAASNHYRKVLDLKPGDTTVLNNLAYILTEFAGKPDEALRYAQQAKEFAPDNPAVDDTLGWTYYRKGLYPNAVRHLEAAVEREPNARRTFHLAMAYAKSGNVARGKRTLEVALKLDPKSPEAGMAQQVVAESDSQSR